MKILAFSVFPLKNINWKVLIYCRLSKANLKIQDSINHNKVLIE